MNVHEETIAKIHQLPESVVQEVNDFIDFLQMRRDNDRWQLWMEFTETIKMADSDFSQYLPNLEDYEEGLARGEIQW